MQTNKILSAQLIDIIFDGRNKDYGAYELRNKYNRRIKKALLVTGLLVVLVFGTVLFVNATKKSDNQYRISGAIDIIDLAKEKEPEKLPEPEKVQPKPTPAKEIIFTEPEIVDQPETPPPSQPEIEISRIGDENRDGDPDDGAPDPGPDPKLGDKTGVIEPKAPLETGPRERVDVDAKYDGWKRYLETNLNAEVPVNNGAPAGRYSVVIKFVVDVDGSISEITALTNHGYGLEQEAIRVIKKSKKWEPAFLDGVHVKAYKKQVIVFDVLEE